MVTDIPETTSISFGMMCLYSKGMFDVVFFFS
jgi:hypothetical protein